MGKLGLLDIAQIERTCMARARCLSTRGSALNVCVL